MQMDAALSLGCLLFSCFIFSVSVFALALFTFLLLLLSLSFLFYFFFVSISFHSFASVSVSPIPSLSLLSFCLSTLLITLHSLSSLRLSLPLLSLLPLPSLLRFLSNSYVNHRTVVVYSAYTCSTKSPRNLDPL